MPKLTEKQLIGALRELREIKPRKEWVSLIKSQILEPAKSLTEKEADFAKQNIPLRTWSISNLLPRLNYQRKLAYAFASLVFIIVGTFGFAHYTMPGDLLFPVKKITETKDPFQIAYNRSSELVQILKENKTEKIAPAVSEFKASISGAAKNLVESMASVDSKKSLKEIAVEVKKIQDNQKQAETLGIDISQTSEAKELDDALASLVKEQIDSLEEATLTEAQQEVLLVIKDLYDQQNYFEALEEILLINK